jgi:hypothetical protein
MHRLILLMAGHMLCDYPLQGDFLAVGKNRNLGICFCGKRVHRVKGDFWADGPEVCKDNHWHKPIPTAIPWWHCLTAHALIQAGMVYLITGNVWLFAAELVIHWVTDSANLRSGSGLTSTRASISPARSRGHSCSHGQRAQFRSHLSLRFASTIVCHCILPGASAPPQLSGLMWSIT